MQSRLRAAIAAATIAHSARRQVASVYDHDSQRQLELHAQASEGKIACYDLADRSGLSGELPELIYAPDGTRIHVAETGSGEYQGFDHGGETHFNLRVDGLSAWLYDHDEKKWFSYTARSASF